MSVVGGWVARLMGWWVGGLVGWWVTGWFGGRSSVSWVIIMGSSTSIRFMCSIFFRHEYITLGNRI